MGMGYNCYNCGTIVHMSGQNLKKDIPREEQLCLQCYRNQSINKTNSKEKMEGGIKMEGKRDIQIIIKESAERYGLEYNPDQLQPTKLTNEGKVEKIDKSVFEKAFHMK